MSYPEQTTGIGVAARIGLDTAAIFLPIGGTHQIKAAVTDVQGTKVATINPIGFASQNASVAEVSSSGLVTAVSPGLAYILVTYSIAPGRSITAEVSVRVVPPCKESK